MPIYEYECTKCGHQKEALQKFSDSPLTKCQSCGGKMKKLVSQSTFHLKGVGWYVTDYAPKSGGNQESGTIPDNKVSSTQSKDSAETSETKKSSSKGSNDTSKAKDSSSEQKTKGE